MKFYIKEKQFPNIGERRIITKFAFLPIRIHENLIIWLHPYRQIQEYKMGFYSRETYWITLKDTLQTKKDIINENPRLYNS